KLMLLLFVAVFSFKSIAQAKDTLVIEFSGSFPEMRKGKKAVSFTNKKDSLFSYYYSIKKKVPKEYEYVYLMLSHHIQLAKTIEYFDSGYINPITKQVDKSYFENKKVLDISF